MVPIRDFRAVSRAVDSLESKGCVVHVRQHEDRRAYSVLPIRPSRLVPIFRGVYDRLYALVRRGIADEEKVFWKRRDYDNR